VVVDDTTEVRLALRFAARRARNVGGRVTLLRVIQPNEEVQEHWLSVAEQLREEAREAAEHLLSDIAQQVQQETGLVPELIIREGNSKDELLKLIDSDPAIRILVLAAAPGPSGPGPLVTALAGQMAGNMRVPVTVVPGSLTNEEIDELT
jgi:nucleotide-binding universal stress UspA family protein